MRGVFILIFMFLPLAHADETFSISPPNAKAAANAYAHAAGLSPIVNTEGFDLRVWTRDYMLGRVTGTVVSDGTEKSFKSSSSYSQDNITVKAAHLSGPKRVANLTELKKLVVALEPYDKAFISCGVMDGGSVLIDATVQGQEITFEVDNPEFCKDKASQIVVRLLNFLAS